MRVIDLDLTDNEKIDIFGLFDVHQGSGNHAAESFQKAINLIKNNAKQRRTYTILGGDSIAAINYRDKRFNPLEICADYGIKDLKNLPQKQCDIFLEQIDPIKNIVLCNIEGNHEEKYALMNGWSPADYIADQLKVPLLGKSGFVNISFLKPDGERRLTYVMFVLHGVGGSGSTPAYALNQVHGIAASYMADIYWMGHLHTMVDDMIERTSPYGEKLVRRKAYFGVNGCFEYKDSIGTNGYMEGRKGRQASIGILKLTIEPNRSKSDSIVKFEKIWL